MHAELKDLSVPAQVDGDKAAQTRLGKIGTELRVLDTETISVVMRSMLLKGDSRLPSKTNTAHIPGNKPALPTGTGSMLRRPVFGLMSTWRRRWLLIRGIHQHHRSFNLLGFNTPNHNTFRIMSERVLISHLDALPLAIKNDLRLISSPRERVTFGEVISGYLDYVQGPQDGWAASVENQIARILGEELIEVA